MDKVAQIMSQLDQMILRANQIVEDASVQYEAALGGDLAILRADITEGNRSSAIHQAYRIKGRAGTLGWPLISAGVNALAKLLERCPDLALGEESVTVHLETLSLMFQQKMKGEDPRGQPMVRDLYKILEKECDAVAAPPPAAGACAIS